MKFKVPSTYEKIIATESDVFVLPYEKFRKSRF